MKLCLMLGMLIPYAANAFFDTWRAAQAYKNNNIECAEVLYNNLVVNNPDHYESLYNLGKIAYKKKQFETAQAYFEKTLQQEIPQQLKEQTFFDLGNTHVNVKQWHDALKNFEEVLKINADHEHAKKMVEQIKKILAEEQKQEEQQKEQNKNQKQDQKQDQDQKEDQQEDENQDQKDDNNDQDSQQENNNSENKNKQDNDQNNQPNKNQNQQQQDKQKQNQQQEQQQKSENNDSQKQQQDEKKAQENNDQQQKQTEQEQQKAAADKAMQEKQKNATQSLASDAKKTNQEKDVQKDYETMLLQQVENEDAAMTKMLLQRQLQSEMVRHGQKNW